jgi:hypothetical protein
MPNVYFLIINHLRPGRPMKPKLEAAASRCDASPRPPRSRPNPGTQAAGGGLSPSPRERLSGERAGERGQLCFGI